MPDRDQERMDAISEALARMLARQKLIEQRLAAIERSLEMGPVEAPPAVMLEPAPPPAEPAPQPAAPAPPAAQPPARPPLESRMGTVWVNRAGVVTVVLAVAFFFKYAVDNRWIGERGRVLLGVAAGLAALAGAEWFRRAGQRIFAQGICGAGVAILYVSTYAAYGFYSLIAHGMAFGLMSAITVTACALALAHGSAAIAALGLAGGYLTPLVLSTGEDRPWAFLSYVLVLSAGAMALARVRPWRALEALAFAAAQGLYWSWIFEFHKSDKTAGWVFALLYFALFAAARLRWIAALNQAAAVIALLAVSAPDAAPGLPLAVLVLASGLLLGAGPNERAVALASFAGFWLPYAVAHFTLKEHNSAWAVFLPLTAAFAAAALWTPWQLRRGRAWGGAGLALAALNAACYFTAGYDLLDAQYPAWMGLFAVALALAHLGLARELRANARATMLYAGIALAFTTLAIPVQFAGYRITMAWALEAAALAWIAARTRDWRLEAASLAVFVLAGARLLAVDARMYPNPAVYSALWNVRFLTFAVTVAALWAAARWLTARLTAAPAYVAGHFLLLWGLALEVLAWAERRASAPDIANLQSASISILLAAYAVLLVAAGVARRSPLDRILGLGLLAVVVLKLYLYDVWQITRGMYRVAAFAGLGIFLLITSYLYSRFRGSVEAWWRRER
ncbi:MAG TPA: DUF2339 domain-containing protein [Bryobacteraceae bacterium]|nr:DUF2339 domain-containing protein [Bryobacteraceae bacterium]